MGKIIKCGMRNFDDRYFAELKCGINLRNGRVKCGMKNAEYWLVILAKIPKKLLLERNFWRIIQINNNNLEDVQFYLNSLPITSDKIQ